MSPRLRRERASEVGSATERIRRVRQRNDSDHLHQITPISYTNPSHYLTSNFIFMPTIKNMPSSLAAYTDKYFLPDELALSFVKSITEIVLQVSDNSPKIRWGMDEPIPGQIPA